MQQKLLAYAKDRYDTTPEYLWSKAPDYAVLRHKHNKKWYAVLMNVPRFRLGLAGDGAVDIMNVKCEPWLVEELLQQEGCRPAYHMNKKYWLTVLLDGSVEMKMLTALLDKSFAATNK